ncbi:organic cation transporter protein-like [Amphibalanus amphitrite]|uniref:organic cation transporter protein-like n=1 Tax=Amphibalanus amphitrite TaxID=1232801 RepID=UPI001C92A6D4|nr:organic cation transporter protein-like [Amphibalanus amphitrite]
MTAAGGGGDDPVLAAMGTVGRWQACQSLLLSLVGVVCGWQVLVIAFLAPPTAHWCAPPSPHWDDQQWRREGIPDPAESAAWGCRSYVADTNSTSVRILDRNRTVPCRRWTYNTSEYDNNVVIEWDLVCDRRWLQMFAQAIYMVGIGCGVLFWGVFADRYGRRPTLLLCVMLACLSGNGCAAVNSVQLFLVFRFMIAFCGIGAYCACFVTCMEMLGDWWRVVVGIAFCMPMSLGYMTLAVLAYFVRHWRALQVAVSLPGILYMAYYWVVPESPRWLLSRGRANEAVTIMKRARLYNKMPVLDNLLTTQGRAEPGEATPAGCRPLAADGRMLALVGCLFVCWLVNSMVFYGILLNTGDFGDNIYMNAFLGGAVEVPAYAACIYAILRLGRRRPIALAMTVAGLSCLLTLAFDPAAWRRGWPVVCLGLLGRFGITASFGAIYVYSAELFPTALRNTGLAVCSVGSRFGGILAPMLQLLRDDVHPSLPVVVYGLSAVGSGLSVLLLPETAGRPLPETVADVFGDTRRSETHDTTAEQQPLDGPGTGHPERAPA